MLGTNDARKVIEQLQTETFLCTKNTISTSDFVIVKKKPRKITDDKIIAAVKLMEGK